MIVLNGTATGNGMDWALHRLGLLYKSQGIAEKMYQRALQGKEKAWSLDHPSTFSTINNLGLLYVDQGRLGDAEKMYLRVLQGKEKAWGPSTQNTVNSLGLLQGKLDKAEKMYQWALQGKEQA